MTKQEYWEAHKRKNPKFADDSTKIELTVGMLRRLMEEAYDRGLDHARAVQGNVSKLKDILGW